MTPKLTRWQWKRAYWKATRFEDAQAFAGGALGFFLIFALLMAAIALVEMRH